jgi:hypothetical protein
MAGRAKSETLAGGSKLVTTLPPADNAIRPSEIHFWTRRLPTCNAASLRPAAQPEPRAPVESAVRRGLARGSRHGLSSLLALVIRSIDTLVQ